MAEQQGGRGPEEAQQQTEEDSEEGPGRKQAQDPGRVAPGDGEDPRVGTERRPMEGRPRNQEGVERYVGGMASWPRTHLKLRGDRSQGTAGPPLPFPGHT